MAELTSIPKDAKLAINRIAMFSEKEKRLLQVAIDAAKSASETSIITDLEAVLAEYEEQTVKWYLMAGTTNQSSVNPARRFMAIGTSAVTLNLDAAASVQAYSYTSPEGVDITWEGNITIANASTQTLTVNPGSGEYFVVNGSSLAPDTAVTLAPGDLIHIIPDTDGDSFWYVHKNQSGSGGGSGDVTKVGTPANDQVGVWTGDGTIEGTSDVTFNGTQFKMGNYVFNTDQAIGGMNGYSLVYNSGSGEIELQVPFTDITLDTAPVLGGNLNVSTFDIISTSNNPIDITSNGSGGITLSSGTTGDINLTPGSTSGNVVIDYSTWPAADGAADQVLSTNGSGALSWVSNAGSGLASLADDTSPQLGANLDVNGFTIGSATAGNISITPDTTGDLILDGLKWPQTDGAADQVLKTDGLGQLSWVANSGSGLANLVDDTTPQLGGTLDSNNFDIEIKNTGTVKGINFYEPSGGGTSYARIVAPALSSSYTLTLPTTDGTSGQHLATNGTGTLSWSTPVVDFSDLGDCPAITADYWLKGNSGGSALEFVAQPVTSLSATSPLARSGATGAVTISIQAAAGPSTDGYMLGSDKAKLDTITADADPTTAATVAAAGAIMDSDFSSTGLMARDGFGYYQVDIVAGDGIVVTNGDAASGANPTIATDITLSTSAPSGTPSGGAGAVWYRYTA